MGSLNEKLDAERARKRVEDQESKIQSLRADGKDTKAAERLLAIYRELSRVLRR
jgi:hypothetical protein